jgi:hypothetical protein
VACVEFERNTYKVLVESEGKRAIGRSIGRWYEKIKTDF